MALVPQFRLSTNALIPSVGLGFWKVPKPQVAPLVEEAVRVGYRHFDCACDYGNEAEVGEGLTRVLQSGGCQRSDLWITSKLWNTYHAAEHVRPACERSLRDLQVDSLDLYLMHFPISQKFVPFDLRYPPGWIDSPRDAQPRMVPQSIPIRETWEAMEELVQDGLVKNIGICNFGVSLLRDLLSTATIRPAVLQIELHPYLTQEKLLRFCQQEQIVVTAFSPLGAAAYFSLNMAQQHEAVLNRPEIVAIAQRLAKTPAQIVLRWGVQRGTVIIPKTVSFDRLQENLAVFDFELSSTDMQTISSMNQNRRFNDPGDFCEQAFGTFFPIYE